MSRADGGGGNAAPGGIWRIVGRPSSGPVPRISPDGSPAMQAAIPHTAMAVTVARRIELACRTGSYYGVAG
jgi:hypothetical protein